MKRFPPGLPPQPAERAGQLQAAQGVDQRGRREVRRSRRVDVVEEARQDPNLAIERGERVGITR